MKESFDRVFEEKEQEYAVPSLQFVFAYQLGS